MKPLLTALAVCYLACVVPRAGAAEGPYHFLKEIPIGGEGGWDYLSVDPEGRRLYVAHNTKVDVVDVDKDEVVGEIADTPGVHGFAIAHDLGRGFSSNGRENKVSIVDLKTLKTISKVETGENPDAIVYEELQHEVYAFNGRGRSATVFEANSGKVVTTIPLPGKPEFAASWTHKGQRIYCNLEDKNAVAVIDPVTHKVLETRPTAPGEEPSGLALSAYGMLYIGCGNKLMVLMHPSGKVLGSVPIGEGVDATACDPSPATSGSRWGAVTAFSSCRDGTVTIARDAGRDGFALLQTLKTEPGARTMTLDAKTHKIYLATAKFEAPGEKSTSGGRQRPRILPGTFKILVYGMEKQP